MLFVACALNKISFIYCSQNGNINSSIVLWENPNPRETFAAQTITLSSSEYNTLEVFYNLATSSPNRVFSSRTYKGKGTRCFAVTVGTTGDTAFFSRNVTYINEKEYSVETGNSSSVGGINNNACVPIKIIGYK